MEQRNTEQEQQLPSPQVVTMLTTEHYNLQSGRSMTIADANGRASLFIGAVSSTLVAIGFIGQSSQMGSAFYIFSLVIFPALFFIGLVTFERVLQTGIEDIVYARGINRIRHFYLEHAPEMRRYFILSDSDDDIGAMRNMGASYSRWQGFLTTAGMIAVIDSIIAGVFCAMLLYALFTLPLPICTIVGGGMFALSLFLFQNYQANRWGRAARSIPVEFPSEGKQAR